MSPRTMVIGIIAACLMLALILELVRRRKLRTGYSLLWLTIGVAALVLILFPNIELALAHLIGIRTPSSLLFIAGIAFAFWILLDHSLTVTRLWRQDKDIAQHQALLEWRVRHLEAQLGALSHPQPSSTELLQSEETTLLHMQVEMDSMTEDKVYETK